jgi:hypothetical protein
LKGDQKMNKLLILPILVFLGNYLPAQEIEPTQNVGQNVGQDSGAMGGSPAGEQWGEGSTEPATQGLTEQTSCLLSQQNSLIQNDKGSESEEGAEGAEGAEGQKCEDGDS